MNTTTGGGDIEKCSATSDPISRTADLILGLTFLLSCVLGTPANLASCYFFSTRAARNSNTLYFNRVYTVISLVDSLICMIQIPVIQLLLFNLFEEGTYSRPTPGNAGSVMFHNRALCDVWSVLWLTLSQTSVLLVALLSLSRLRLLLLPRTRLSAHTA